MGSTLKQQKMCVKSKTQVSHFIFHTELTTCLNLSYSYLIQFSSLQQISSRMIEKAAKFLRQSDTLVVGAGAGIGRDSGLPDFRGDGGFWNNYPPYRNKFSFYECANPNFLHQHPQLFWGFYGSRLAMYRQKQPHEGFHIIKNIASSMQKQSKVDNLFVATSNVDGHFSKAGYAEERLYQCHGSIHYLQCTNCHQIKQNTFQPDVNYHEMSCRNLPTCQKCGEVERPNILMFGDWDWMEQRSARQQKLYKKFLSNNEDAKVAIIEIGCGTAVPTIRNMMEQFYYRNKNSKLIRINPDASQSSAKWLDSQRYVDVTFNALEALQLIQKEYQQ